MYIAKYYISVKKWVPAINRLKQLLINMIRQYLLRKLHRLVEIHYHIGLEREAKKFASILGYNYNSSEWFEQTYKILNKDYKITKKVDLAEKKSQDRGFFKKIIKMIK